MSKTCEVCCMRYGSHMTNCPNATDPSVEEAIAELEGKYPTQFQMGQKCDVLVPGRGPVFHADQVHHTDQVYGSGVSVSDRSAGLKDDGGKLPWGLLFGGMIRALRGVVGVLQFGAKKYKAHSWKEVENGIERYADAQARHWSQIYEHGWDARDPETGKLEIDHINCNGLFLGELIRKHYNIKD